MKKKNPCSSCCQNLKVFQAKIKALEVRAVTAEKSRDTFQLKNAELFDKMQVLSYENLDLKVQIREISWKPSQVQIDIEKIRNQPLGQALEYFYGHHHSIASLGLLQKRHRLSN